MLFPESFPFAMKHNLNILHGLPYLTIMILLIPAVTHGHSCEGPGYLLICAGPVDQLEKPVTRKLAGLLSDSGRIWEIQFNSEDRAADSPGRNNTGNRLLDHLDMRHEIMVKSPEEFVADDQDRIKPHGDILIATGDVESLTNRFDPEQHSVLAGKFRELLDGGGRVVVLSSNNAQSTGPDRFVSAFIRLLSLPVLENCRSHGDDRPSSIHPVMDKSEETMTTNHPSASPIVTGLYDANQMRSLLSGQAQGECGLTPAAIRFSIRKGCAIGINPTSGMIDCIGNHGVMVSIDIWQSTMPDRVKTWTRLSILGDGDRYDILENTPRISSSKVPLPMQDNSGFRPYYKSDMNTSGSLKYLIHGLVTRQTPFVRGGFVVNDREYEIELRRNPETAFFASPDNHVETRAIVNLDCLIRE